MKYVMLTVLSFYLFACYHKPPEYTITETYKQCKGPKCQLVSLKMEEK